MVKWWQQGGTSNADIEDAADVAKSVIPAERTWNMRPDLPFFDTRLLVDMASQFIAASFQVHHEKGVKEDKGRFLADAPPEAAVVTDQGNEAGADDETDGQPPLLPSPSKPPPPLDRQARRPKMRHLHAVCCNAHSFLGYDRLARELVPRCQPLKNQLKQTVTSICAAVNSGDVAREKQLKEAVDYEVDRFLRSRLVVCNLGELMSLDCFVSANRSESDSESDDSNHEEGNRGFLPSLKPSGPTSKKPWKDCLFGDSGGRRGPPPIHPVNEPASMTRSGRAALAQQLAIQSMGHTGASALPGAGGTGVGSAAGGVAEAVRQATRAERTQQKITKGELHLALHSLMGWLPSGVSDSLFLSLVGLPAASAVRQRPEKYAMLLNCVNALVRGSGQYVFVCTPTWYLPLSARLGGLGRMHEIREKSAVLSGGRPVSSLRSIWLNPCLEPEECIAAVNQAWGGSIPGVRAELGLCGGVEPIGIWVLRMTLGCEGLLSVVLEVLREFAPRCEEAYDDLIADGTFHPNLEVPSEMALARCLAEAAAEAVCRRAREKRHLQASEKHADKKQLTKKMTADDLFLAAPVKKHRFRSSKTSLEPLRAEQAEELEQIAQTPRLRSSLVDVQSQSTGACTRRPGERPNLLAQLQRGDMANARSSQDEAAQQRLRRSIELGKTTWPVGQPGRLGGRISIYDSPELLPTAKPPPLEDDKFSLDETAADTSTSQPVRHNSAGTMPRSRTAPQLHHPKSFAEQLQEMAMLSKRSSSSSDRRHRAKSAPPSADTSDFDKGNALKNTAVALALQDELTVVLSSAASEHPLNLLWRQGRSDIEASELQRLRLSLGALLLFAALRASLPCDMEVPLRYFAATVSLGIKEDVPEKPKDMEGDKGRLAPSSKQEDSSSVKPKTPTTKKKKEEDPPPEPSQLLARKPLFQTLLVDGVFSMGCAAIFHTMPSATFARTSPVVSPSFQIALPHAMLNGPNLTGILTEKTGAATSRWSTGSLNVLLASYVLEEEQMSSRLWTKLTGWLRQNHSIFFSVACCFRVIMGFELVSMYHSIRPDDKDISLQDVFPFLGEVRSTCKDLSARLNLSATSGGRPLLRAPKISPHLPARHDFNPNFVEWGPDFSPGGLCADEGVSLKNFATWVGHLRPGRIIYSSPLSSSSADLYLRLKGSVVVFAFASPLGADANVSGPELFRMYRTAVGEASWWGKKIRKIYYIVIASRFEQIIESQFNGSIPSKNCTCLQLKEGDQVPNCFDPQKPLTAKRIKKNRQYGAGATSTQMAETFLKFMASKLKGEKINEKEEQSPKEKEPSKEEGNEEGEEEEDSDEDTEEGSDSCIRDRDCVDGLVRHRTEILMCSSACLDRILGPLKGAVLTHRDAFEADILKELSGGLQREEDAKRADMNRAQWTQGSSRPPKRRYLPQARARQLQLNKEGLSSLLGDIYSQTSDLLQMAADINSDSEDNSVLGSAISSRAPSPADKLALPRLHPVGYPRSNSRGHSDSPQPTSEGLARWRDAVDIVKSEGSHKKSGSIGEDVEFEDDSTGDEKSLRKKTESHSLMHWAEMRIAARVVLSALRRNVKRRPAAVEMKPRVSQPEARQLLDQHGEFSDDIAAEDLWQRLKPLAPEMSGDERDEMSGCVKFEKDLWEPRRTEKRLLWRPPTPHPVQSAEAARRIGNVKRGELRPTHESKSKSSTKYLHFDWLGWNSWGTPTTT
eukprot:TRINITY_DN22612_c1_g1_i2.p1 TRINITY_DN22612_c1_g1~~TRINITY_DN22612_c1_g1_i2.p1  ORF type:complete len:1708 (-),score=244.94 TRINITY_DN22612_c1_g1_i2:58-5181(-)